MIIEDNINTHNYQKRCIYEKDNIKDNIKNNQIQLHKIENIIKIENHPKRI